MDNFFNTVSEIFFLNSKPLIIMDYDGSNLIFNKNAERIFNHSELLSIKELFPKLILSIENNEQICNYNNIPYHINLKLSYEKNQWIIEIQNSFDSEWDEFVINQKKLHVLFLDLLSVKSEDDLYKKLVTKSRKLFDIDRMGILLCDIDNQLVRGSWGTDDVGDVVCQTEYEEHIDSNRLFKDSLSFKDYITFTEDTELYNMHNVVGIGWNSKSVFYAGNNPIGWISCDNYFGHKPLPRWKKEILSELSRMTGEFVFNLRLEKHLKEEVEKKTLELNETITKLKEMQENLIESEKLASLGSLISGVAHEINTPVGVAITSSSHIKEKTQSIMDLFYDNRLTKTQLESFLKDNLYASQLASSSLQKAGELVDMFKQLSTDQNSELLEATNLSTLINNVIKSMKYSSKLDSVKFILDIDPNITLKCNYGGFYQIFVNLINNSIIHGFKNIKNPQIFISSFINGDIISIIYSDNGVGIPKNLHKKVFEPFFTTKRDLGSTGLGLSIVYNNLIKIGGSISLCSIKGTQFTIDIKI